MTLNKEWMGLFEDRFNDKYKAGVEMFLNFAFQMAGGDSVILCPCIKCINTEYQSRDEVKSHLNVNGIMKNYKTWFYHGEKPKRSSIGNENMDGSDEDIEDILTDLYHGLDGCDRTVLADNSSCQSEHREEPNKGAKAFYRLLKGSEEPCYPGSETSKLSILVHLLHIKSIGRWSNESFNMLLQLLKRLLPTGSTLPESYYEAKKIIKDLSLSYKRIDACKNDCMLYWKEKKDSNCCEVCGASRWKEDNRTGEEKVGATGKKLAIKTLRYFPLKPRLQRLFMSTKIASFMRWHHEKRADDGVMRHPADSLAWKSFDDLHKDFSAETRNVRLGLASDGFQPFTHSKSSYSIWPVILIPYNLPPWMCMKEYNFILSMLIPGPESPGDSIDVYLKPLIEELTDLWEVGVETVRKWSL